MRFMSDNTASASTEIVDAIIAVNRGLEPAYGDDPWSKRLDQAFGAFFATEVRVFTVATGTAANSLALATVTPPYGAIFAHAEAHVVRERESFEDLVRGEKIVSLPPGGPA